MLTTARSRRRWFGAFSVLGALGMLVLGLTWLEGRLTGLGFLGYWLICFLLTFLAMVTALWDAYAVRRENRERQRELIQSTIAEIQAGRKRGRGTE